MTNYNGRMEVAFHETTALTTTTTAIMGLAASCCSMFGNVAGHDGAEESTGASFIAKNSPRIQTGICYNSWEFNLLLSLISLLLWCYVLLILGSLAALMQDREQLIRAKRMENERMEFVHKMIKIKVRSLKGLVCTRVLMAYFRKECHLIVSVMTRFCVSQKLHVQDALEESSHSQQSTLSRNHNEIQRSKSDSISCHDRGLCSICLEEFCDGDEVCESYNCCHRFHLEACMNKWLLAHDECPMCRQDFIISCSKRERCKRHGIHRIPYVDPVVVTESAEAMARGHAWYDGAYHNGALRYRDPDLAGTSDLPPWLVFTGAF